MFCCDECLSNSALFLCRYAFNLILLSWAFIYVYTLFFNVLFIFIK
nr:MAG TPA: S67, SPIDER VENOM PEPTIDE, ICK [Caudoviricetes sp.]